MDRPLTTGDTIELVVSSDMQAMGLPARLDHYLAERMAGLSRARIQKLIEDGLVTVDNSMAKASMRLKGGELVKVTIPPAQPLELTAEDLPVELVFEDEFVAVVNKPAGMITHPGAGVSSGTLVNAILHRIGRTLTGVSGTLRPGIVHRLDKDTSGLLVIAKNDQALHHLQREIKLHKAKRCYIALVEGVVPDDEGTVNQPIARHPQRRKEMAVVPAGKMNG